MPDGMMAHDSAVFTSWKEIASYLGKGVRTVQRWEAQFGLPVQRPNARAKGIVRATREELDQWIATRWSPRLEQSERPDVPVARLPVAAGMDAAHELRMQNRALLIGLRQSLEQLRSTCHDLAINMVNCEFRRDGTTALPSGSAVTENKIVPPASYPARKQAKAG